MKEMIFHPTAKLLFRSEVACSRLKQQFSVSVAVLDA